MFLSKIILECIIRRKITLRQCAHSHISKGKTWVNEMPKYQLPDIPFTTTSRQDGDSRPEMDDESKPWGRAFSTFCEKTTFHGLRNVTDSTRNVTRRYRSSCLASVMMKGGKSEPLKRRLTLLFTIMVNVCYTT